jgi:integrase
LLASNLAVLQYSVGTQMADGVEVRGNRVRVYFRFEGELCREPLPGDASPERIANAERLVGTINYEIKEGVFSYARHFPESPRVKNNTFGHYLDLWLDIKRNELAVSSAKSNDSRVNTHIRPFLGDKQADQIDHLDLQDWIQSTLMPSLHNKTVREIVSIVRQVFRLYRTRNKSAHDPTDGIMIRLPDPEDPDPFTRDEINAILTTPSKRDQEVNLIRFMMWSGPRVSEALALAWEDVDLEAGTVKFRRARVSSKYKVTKTRRSSREVKLLRPALEALQAQALITKNMKPVSIEVTDRDNRSIRQQSVRFVFHNGNTGTAYSTSDNLRNNWWKDHLVAAEVRYRGPNQCRHTFASQMLTSGKVSVDWIADQMGHSSTAMIWKHYGKWIKQDGPDLVGMLNQALNL